MTTYGRFAVAPIGPGLVARDSGLTLTTNADGVGLNVVARSDVSVTSGIAGYGMAFWGNAPLVSAVGIIQTGGSLNVPLGSAPEGIAWRLDLGTVTQGNATLRSGLPAIVKGDVIGVRIQIEANTLTLYRNGVVIASLLISLTGFSWHYATSLSAPMSGQLCAAVNAGQWHAASEAEAAGWTLSKVAPMAVRLADLDYISAPTDTVPHARYEGVVDADDFTILQSVTFWPWSDEQNSRVVGGATIKIHDDAGRFDSLATQNVDSRVIVALGETTRSRDSAVPAGRFRLDRVEVEDGVSKALHLTDADERLDRPVATGVFLPNLPGLAWKPMPALIGAVSSVPGFPCTSDSSGQWVSDTAVMISDVRDRGDVMELGTWTQDPHRQQLLLKSPPQGPVTMDASSIAHGVGASLTRAMSELMERAGSTAWLQSDAAAIDAATGYQCGFYSADSTTIGTAIDRVLASFTASRYRGAGGNLRICRLIDPDSVSDLQLSFDVDDVLDEVTRIPDTAPGLTRTMAYCPNAKPLQASEFVTDYIDVPQTVRDQLTGSHRGRVYYAGPLAQAYESAVTAGPYPSLLCRESDAVAELSRVCALYAVQRYFYSFSIVWPDIAPPFPGQVGRFRYIDAGGSEIIRKVLVRTSAWNPGKGVVEISGWGR